MPDAESDAPCQPVVERIDGYGTFRGYCPDHDWYSRRYRNEDEARWAVERHHAKAQTRVTPPDVSNPTPAPLTTNETREDT